jgi:hypothetical protein
MVAQMTAAVAILVPIAVTVAVRPLVAVSQGCEMARMPASP